MDKRRFKGFDYHARDPKPDPEAGFPPDDVANPEPEEEPHADRSPEAGLEMGGEGEGRREGEESSRDEGPGAVESEG
ncbi:hypothetical protein LCGC14_1086040 [marine sediment metagenome]|uniref:Uncharacterized protein n=1 Tax=marine sediment metagenome TaxID=412755 RepID=A0A0F9MI97_9ZZZZ